MCLFSAGLVTMNILIPFWAPFWAPCCLTPLNKKNVLLLLKEGPYCDLWGSGYNNIMPGQKCENSLKAIFMWGWPVMCYEYNNLWLTPTMCCEYKKSTVRVKSCDCNCLQPRGSAIVPTHIDHNCLPQQEWLLNGRSYKRQSEVKSYHWVRI